MTYIVPRSLEESGRIASNIKFMLNILSQTINKAMICLCWPN